MKRIILLAAVAGFTMLLWKLIENMSSDALGLAIGVVFGVLAGLPTALLVLASRNQADRAYERRNDREERRDCYHPGNRLPSPDERRAVSKDYPTYTIQDSLDRWDAIDAQKEQRK